MRISDWSSDVCSSDLVEVADVARVEPAILVDGRLGLHGTPPVARHHHRAPHQDLPCLAAIHCDAVLIDDPQLDEEAGLTGRGRSEEHTSELQSLMRNSYAVFCLNKKNLGQHTNHNSKPFQHSYHLTSN